MNKDKPNFQEGLLNIPVGILEHNSAAQYTNVYAYYLSVTLDPVSSQVSPLGGTLSTRWRHDVFGAGAREARQSD